MNHLLENLKDHMKRDLEIAIEDREGEILEAIKKLSDEREGDAPLKFSCAIGAVLNLDKSMVETTFSFSVKTSVKSAHLIKDPNQPELI